MPNEVAVYWLIVGTGISTIVSGLYYMIQGACSKIFHNLGAHYWQQLAARLDLRAESFEKLSNGVVYPRILLQLGLKSYKVVYLHDANAQTGDCVQWGWMRLPTKSWILTVLSFCGVSHYVYIHHDLRSMEIVGPAAGIRALVAVSSTAATSRLAEEDLLALKEAMGMGESMTHADRLCVFWEKRLMMGIVSGGVVLGIMCQIVGPFRVLLVSSLVCSLLSFAVYLRQCRFLLSSSSFDDLWSPGTHVAEDDSSMPLAEQPLLYDHEGGVDSEAATQEISMLIGSTPSATTEAETAQETDVELLSRVSILTARSHYYEPVRTFEVAPVAGTPLVQFTHSPQVFAVDTHPNLIYFLAARTQIPMRAALHICVYNPMIDPYLVEICENFKKGVDVENLLMVVLPHLFSLSAEFTDSTRPRNRTAHGTQYVTTLLDFEGMLMQMASGIFRNLVFIIPVDRRTLVSQVEEDTWQACCHVYGHDHCHWLVERPTRSTEYARSA